MRRLPLVLMTAAALMIGGCGPSEARRTDRTPNRTLRIGSAPVMGNLPLFVAIEEDMFAAHGITVESVPFTNSNDAVNAMIAGQMDLIPAISLIPILNLEIQHPATVRVFAHSRAVPERASDSIVVPSDSTIRSLGHLANRKIGVFPGTSAMRMLEAFLKRNEVRTDAITFVPLTPATQISALSSGAIDALFGYEPTTTIARESGEFRLLHGSVYASLLNPSPLGGAVISRDFERREPEVAAAAVAALDDAVRFMRSHPAETLALIPEIVPVEPGIAAKLTIVESGLSTENDLAALEAMVNLLHEIDEIPERIDARRLTAPTLAEPGR